MSDNRAHEVNLLDLIAFVLRWRVFLITAVLSVSVVVAVISFLLPPRYRSTAVVRGSESSSQGGIGGLVASKLSALGGIAGIAPALGEIPGELHLVILKSTWMAEKTITEFGLAASYGMEKAPIEDVIEAFKSRTNFELEPQSQTVLISAEDESPKRAQEMVAFLVDALDNRNSELRSVSSRRQREFIGRRLDEARQQLGNLEDSLSRFQSETGVFSLEEQVKATIGAAAALEAQKLALESELEISRQMYGSDGISDAMIRLKLAGITSSLRRLSDKKASADKEFDFLLHLKDAPEQGLTYLRLMRDIEVQQILAALLIQQYEQARIDEKRDTPTISRIDPPNLAMKRVWPRRSIMVGVAAFGTFIFACAFALILEFFRYAATTPTHPQYRESVTFATR